jgi:UDP-glucose 4-epimerase
MRVLVTGSAGFIGTNVVRYLRGKEANVYGIDLLGEGSNKVDIRDYSALENAFERSKPEFVIHLAANAYPQKCEVDCDACFSTNVNGTYNVAKLAKNYGSKIIFASTAAVYGKAEVMPTPVKSATKPTNLYGLTKLIGESIVRYYAPENHTIFRIFNVYGEYCDRSYVIPDTIRKLMLDERPVPMMGTGNEERDFIYIGDVNEAFYMAIASGNRYGTYNLGTGSSISIKDLSKKISELLDIKGATFSFQGKPRIGDINKLLADVSGENSFPGWKPKTRLDEGVSKTIDYFTK